MRNTGRIFPLCNEIAILWADVCPDWRFTQLMNNFLSWMGSDCFYVEDDRFLQKFKEFMEWVTKKELKAYHPKMTAEELRQYLHFKKRGGKVAAKKGKGSYNRQEMKAVKEW